MTDLSSNKTIRRNREKLLALIAVAVIIAALIFGAIINPQLKKRQQRIGRLHKLQLKLTRMEGDLLIKDRIDNIYSDIEPFLTGDGTDQQEISLFARELSELYSKLNVKIRSVKILPCTNEVFYRRLSIKIEMSGHIKNIVKFIIAVETHLDPLRIEQLDLRAQETKDRVRASLVVSKVVSEPNSENI